MFLHNYMYRLKCLIRDKETVFWTMIFPLVLATLFNMAFSNIANFEGFSPVKVGIVDNQELQENTNFLRALASVTGEAAAADGRELFIVSYVSREEAEALLRDNKISGYIYIEEDINLVVKHTGINQSIIKSFLDDFKQTTSTVMTIVSRNPLVDQELLINTIAERSEYLKEQPIGMESPDPMVVYFYSLIAMACLYGGFWGMKEVTAIQANQSPQGARISLAPAHKMKLFLASMLAATTIQMGIISVLLTYMSFILKISFGGRLSYIILICLVGTTTGVTFGTFISSVVKRGEGIKIGILIGVTQILSFLAGMMYDKMKYIINTKAPILGILNPINLIADSFYALYYYDSYNKFFMNIAYLCGFIVVFSMITYMVLRRQKYGSI